MFIEENHRIVQKTLLVNSEVDVNNKITIGKIKRDGFLDEVRILFLSALITTGTARVSVHAGSAPDRILIPNFLVDPVVTAAISAPKSILTINAGLASSDKTNPLVRTMGDIVKWVYANKPALHSMTATDLEEGFYILVFEVTAGTVAQGTNMATEVIIGQ